MHLHPATVHFPIAYLVLGNAAKLGQAFFPAFTAQLLPVGINVADLARFLQAAGLVTSLPAIFTGSMDVLKMVRKQGLYEPHTGKLRPKLFVAATHTFATGLAIALAAVMYTQQPLPEHAALAVESIGIALLLYGAKLGGALAFEYGMGFSAARKPSKQS